VAARSRSSSTTRLAALRQYRESPLLSLDHAIRRRIFRSGSSWSFSLRQHHVFGGGVLQSSWHLPSISSNLSSGRMNTMIVRTMAQITGHKKTTKKNKKKRAAIQRKKEAKAIKAGKMKRPIHPRQGGPRVGGGKGRKRGAPKPPFYDTPLPPDYPLGPNYVPPEEVEQKQVEIDVPPLMMSATASRWAFIATAACDAATAPHGGAIRPHKLFDGCWNMDVADFRQKLMFAGSGSFVYFSPKDLGYEYPKYQTRAQNEVAFVGRSNVGKSSLINALMGSKLALTSKQPGRTQQPYYYGWVNDSIDRRKLETTMAAAFFVDLPGYGYAIGPDQAVDSWQQTTQDYLTTRRDAGALRRVFVLQDSRLGVAQDMDDSVCSWLDEAEIPYSIVLTKADAPLMAIKHANMCSLRYQRLLVENPDEPVYMSPVIHITSAKKGTGLVELLSTIAPELHNRSSNSES
jgi:GTP-binding protein